MTTVPALAAAAAPGGQGSLRGGLRSTLRGSQDRGRRSEGCDADLDRNAGLSLQVAEPCWIAFGAAVRCDDEITIAASVVGQRRRARVAAPRTDRCEQEERDGRELAAHDAASGPEFYDHTLVEAVPI